VPAPDS